jgi:hypothetical protein
MFAINIAIMEMIAIFLIMKWFVDENNRERKRGDRGKKFIYLIKVIIYNGVTSTEARISSFSKKYCREAIN